MNPSELSAHLRRIAAKIDNSTNPDKNLVTRELCRVLASLRVNASPQAIPKIGGNSMEENVLVVKSQTSLLEFWDLFPEDTEDHLIDLRPDGRSGDQEVVLKGVGRVKYWLGACSKGSDRGYVVWYELLDVHDENGKPIVLESGTDVAEVLFAGRRSKLV